VYYLRIIVAMYFRDPPEQEVGHLEGRGAPLVAGLAATASLALGIFAGPVLDRADLAATGMNYPMDAQTRATRVDGLRAAWEVRDGLVRPAPPAEDAVPEPSKGDEAAAAVAATAGDQGS
jgi:hypothetical protein